MYITGGVAGVNQGEPLSPILFILLINDMYVNIIVQNNDTFSEDDLRIFILLLADDTVLLSNTPDGLQNLSNQLHSYCTKWGISVNNFYQTQKSLSDQANKAMYSLFSIFNIVGFDIKDKLRFFDSMNSPISFSCI